MASLLECHRMSAGHAGRRVVRDFDLTLEDGEVVAILGPNGAGKTTVLMTLGGLLARLGGSGHILGHAFETTKGRIRPLQRHGVVLVPDDRSLFTTLTTHENLAIARRKGSMSIADIVRYFPQLEPRLKLSAGMLSGGEQQMLALGRALIQRPRILLVDELSMGLAPRVVEDLLPLLRRVASEEGMAIVLVEQHTRLALQTADRAVVMAHGDTVLRGEAAELLSNEEALEQAYFGLGAASSSSQSRT